MRTTSSLVVCMLGLLLHSVNGDLVNDMIEKLLKDPHSREIIENVQAQLDHQLPVKKDGLPSSGVSESTVATGSNDGPPRYSVGWGYRGGDEKSKSDEMKKDSTKSIQGGDALGPPGRRFGAIRGGDSTEDLDNLLVQLKATIQDTLETTANQNPKEESKRNAAKEILNAQRLEFPWSDSQSQNSWIPWTKRSYSLDEKKALYKRVINDINELFAMATNEATNDVGSNNDDLSLDASKLTKRS